MQHRLRLLAAVVGLAVVAGACGDDDTATTAGTSTSLLPAGTVLPPASTPSTSSSDTSAPNSGTADLAGQSFTVGSANFSESVLLAEIYGGALEAAGAKVTFKTNIGSREVYYAAVEKGEVDLLPEYTNSLLSFVLKAKDPNATPTAKNVDEQVTALKDALPSSLTVLKPSSAEDKDVIVCNKATADQYSLKTLSDLGKVAGQVTLGGPPEFAERSPFGIPGFKQFYGATFKQFQPLEIGPPLVEALKANAVNCANLFSTDAAITANGLVSLTDDKNIVPNEAILPLVRADKAKPEVSAVLDKVNDQLDTEGLVKLNAEVQSGGKAESDVAQTWLKDNGLTK